ILHFRHIRHLLVVGSATTGLFLACSSDQTSRNRDTTGSSSSTTQGAGGDSTTTGLLTGPGAGGSINPTTGAGGGGGTGQPPLIPCDPPNVMCPMGQICVKAPMGSSSPGVCSKDGGPCNPAMDQCSNDTYCCGMGCRIDGNS